MTKRRRRKPVTKPNLQKEPRLDITKKMLIVGNFLAKYSKEKEVPPVFVDLGFDPNRWIPIYQLFYSSCRRKHTTGTYANHWERLRQFWRSLKASGRDVYDAYYFKEGRRIGHREKVKGDTEEEARNRPPRKMTADQKYIYDKYTNMPFEEYWKEIQQYIDPELLSKEARKQLNSTLEQEARKQLNSTLEQKTSPKKGKSKTPAIVSNEHFQGSRGGSSLADHLSPQIVVETSITKSGNRKVALETPEGAGLPPHTVQLLLELAKSIKPGTSVLIKGS